MFILVTTSLPFGRRITLYDNHVLLYQLRESILQLEEKYGNFYLVVLILRAHMRNENRYASLEGIPLSPIYSKTGGTLIFSSFHSVLFRLKTHIYILVYSFHSVLFRSQNQYIYIYLMCYFCCVCL